MPYPEVHRAIAHLGATVDGLKRALCALRECYSKANKEPFTGDGNIKFLINEFRGRIFRCEEEYENCKDRGPSVRTAQDIRVKIQAELPSTLRSGIWVTFDSVA